MSDGNLSPQEKEFRRAFPETWERMQQEKKRGEESAAAQEDANLTPQEREFKRQFPKTWERVQTERSA